MHFKGLKITTVNRGKVTLYRWEGELDPEVYYEIINFLKEKVVASHSLIDLSGVRYISSAGVSALLTLNKLSGDAGKKLIIFGLTSSARQVLQLTRLYDNFHITETEDEAMKKTA